MLRIGQISTSDECAAVKKLVLEFVAWANTQDPDAQTAPTFNDLEAELDGLPGKYAPPTGSFLLATNDRRTLGCVAFRELDQDTVELKRMYVRPDQRGNGIGSKLVQELLEVARAQGRKRIILDSYHTMTGAHKIYRAAGFRDVAAPEGFPEHYLGRVIFMEMDLS
jgi:GNAT superfamily N-acetyltransferase